MDDLGVPLFMESPKFKRLKVPFLKPGDRVNLDGSLDKSASWSGKIGGISWDCSEGFDVI